MKSIKLWAGVSQIFKGTNQNKADCLRDFWSKDNSSQELYWTAYSNYLIDAFLVGFKISVQFFFGLGQSPLPPPPVDASEKGYLPGDYAREHSVHVSDSSAIFLNSVRKKYWMAERFMWRKKWQNWWNGGKLAENGIFVFFFQLEIH